MSRKRHRSEIGAATEDDTRRIPSNEHRNGSDVLCEKIRRAHNALLLYKSGSRDKSRMHDLFDPIPGFVNEIVAEFSSSSCTKITPLVKDMVISVIIDFVEPHLIGEMSRDGEKVSAQSSLEAIKICRNSYGREMNELEFSERYNRRSVAWASNMIRKLLYPGKETDIPELDALLASTGSNNIPNRESSIQNMLLNAVRRIESKCAYSRASVVTEKNHSSKEVTKGSTDKSEAMSGSADVMIWAQSPEAWLLEIKNRRNANKSHRANASKLIPYLAQMEDFIKRHSSPE